MDKKEYRNIYNYLKKISEYDADILSSERYEQLLSVSDLETSQNLFEDSLRMQLAEEAFERISLILLESEPEPMPIEMQQEQFVRQMIRRKISFYAEEEKRALLLEMIQNLKEYQRNPMKEKEALQLRQKSLQSLEVLEEPLIEEIIDVSVKLVETIDVNDWKEDTIHSESEEIESDFCVGASAGAVYMLDEKLRIYPEVIGIITGATAVIFYAIKKNNITFIGNLLFMIASAMVTTVFFSYALGMGVSSIGLIFQKEHENENQKEIWVVFFYDAIQVFYTEVQAFGLSKWVYEGISVVENLWNYDEETMQLLDNTNSFVVEHCLYKEIEEVDDDEEANEEV